MECVIEGVSAAGKPSSSERRRSLPPHRHVGGRGNPAGCGRNCGAVGTSGIAEKAARAKARLAQGLNRRFPNCHRQRPAFDPWGKRMSVTGLSPYDDQNIFAQILHSEIPSKRIYEDEWAVAFNDIAPKAPIHVLVIPKGRSMLPSRISASRPARPRSGASSGPSGMSRARSA